MSENARCDHPQENFEPIGEIREGEGIIEVLGVCSACKNDVSRVYQFARTRTLDESIPERDHPPEPAQQEQPNIAECPECGASGEIQSGYGGYHAVECPECGEEWVEG